MTLEQIMAAIRFGKEAIEDYKERGMAVPEFVYERMMELYEQLISVEEKEEQK